MRCAVFDAAAPGGVRLGKCRKRRFSVPPTLLRRGTVVCRVVCAGLNPVDSKFVLGDKVPSMAWAAQSLEGSTPGFDFSGYVLDAPKNSGFQKDQAVYGLACDPAALAWGSLKGSLAEVVAAPIDQIAKKPETLTFQVRGAALPLAWTTVLQALEPVARRGDRILVIGASGGVGHCAVQIAIAKYSAEVTAICSGANEAFVRYCGAAKVLDYTKCEVFEELKADVAVHGPFDVVLDCVSSNDSRDSDYAAMLQIRPALLSKRRGNYVVLGGSPLTWCRAGLKKCGVDTFRGAFKLFWITMPHASEWLAEAAALVDACGLKPRVEAVAFESAGLCEAFEKLRSRRTKGKLVVDVSPAPIRHVDDRT
ncbi:hypothetical protein M885DRAFT_593387 [Pelagophyceae sp. CCMP2097]|nr:hypothetical protein M885DRAFT_593387 [Pelagophyceae sp. CCMP2097]